MERTMTGDPGARGSLTWLDSAAQWGLALFFAVAALSIAAQNVVYLGMAAWLAGAWLRPGRNLGFPRVLAALAPFLAWALVASLHSPNQAHSLFTWRRWLLAAITAYAAGAPRDRGDLVRSVRAFILGGGATFLGAALWSFHGPLGALAAGRPLAETLRLWTGNGAWRAAAGSGGYMVLGTCSMLYGCMVLGLVLEDPDFRRPWVLGGLAAAAAALVLSFTRSAWFGAFAGVLLLLGRKRLAWAAAAAAVLAATLLVPGNPLRHRVAQSWDMSQDSTRERVYMAEAGVGIIRDHPWLGVGDAMASWAGGLGFYRRYMPAAARKWPTLRDHEQGHLHDDFIQVAAMYGVPALALLLGFFGALTAVFLAGGGRGAGALRRGLAWGAVACVLAWWCNGIAEYNFGSAQSGALLWGLLGWALAAARLDGDRC